ncbi:MAG: hypothetical protein LBC61_06640 [Candidatus Peribacteria bacterium]|nr:hypothetical protein [Candidatus Peribacteria bacterium]
MKMERDLPSECYFCKVSTKNFLVCEDCVKKFEVYFDKAIILTNYNSKLISRLIKDAKFYNKKEIFEDFANYLYEKFLLNHKIKLKDDYIISSIPSHFFRLLKRGYNSSEVLSKYFSKISGIKYEKRIVIKTKNVKQQSKLSREERLINLK